MSTDRKLPGIVYNTSRDLFAAKGGIGGIVKVGPYEAISSRVHSETAQDLWDWLKLKNIEEMRLDVATIGLCLSKLHMERQLELMLQDDAGMSFLLPSKVLEGTTAEIPSCQHDWHDVLLLYSTVTECKVCGEKKGQEND